MSTKSNNNIRVLFFFAFALTAGFLSAAEYTWNTPGSDNWSVSANWTGTGSGFPGVGDTATINQGTVEANVSSAIDSDVFLSGTGTLTRTGNNHLYIGNNSPSRVTITQTGGTFLYNPTMYLFSSQINADWNISDGNFSAISASFGAGAGKSGTFNISENATVTITKPASMGSNGYLQAGVNGGTGTINMTGGAIYNTGGSSSEIQIGGSHQSIGGGVGGTGYFNMSGGLIDGKAIAGTTNAKFTVGEVATSDGHVTMTGGTIQNIGDFTVGKLGYGDFEISGGSIESVATITLGAQPTGVGILTIAGGTVTTANLFNGENGNGTVNVSGGTLNVTANLQAAARNNNSTGTLNHTGGIVDVGASLSLGYSTAGVGTYNISGDAELTVANTFSAGNAGTGYLNIDGSEAKITATDFNGGSVYSNIYTTFNIDEYGVSTVYASGTAYLKSLFTVNMSGNFISLQVDHLDLVHAGTLSNLEQFTVQNNTLFDFVQTTPYVSGGRVARLELQNTPTWDMSLTPDILFDGDGLVKGALKLKEGEATWLEVYFNNLDQGWAQAVVDYLNAGMPNSGIFFSVQSNGSILLMGDYLNDDGYALFGWDLTEFNEANNQNISLLGFNQVPEPATWLLLLTGAGGVFFLRKRKVTYQPQA